MGSAAVRALLLRRVHQVRYKSAGGATALSALGKCTIHVQNIAYRIEYQTNAVGALPLCRVYQVTDKVYGSSGTAIA